MRNKYKLIFCQNISCINKCLNRQSKYTIIILTKHLKNDSCNFKQLKYCDYNKDNFMNYLFIV